MTGPLVRVVVWCTSIRVVPPVVGAELNQLPHRVRPRSRARRGSAAETVSEQAQVDCPLEGL